MGRVLYSMLYLLAIIPTLMPTIARWHAVLAVSIASLTHIASTQAPGDANTECLNDSGHPRYDQHVRRLLDTRDYAKLLPYESGVTSGVWQVIDSSDDGVSM